MSEPLISIVTVSYNAVQSIEKTILSVINQTYTNVEYIVVDGGSIDGTVDIIKKYADKITYWVSEPDKGIYDAMNKAIKIGHGEWINFMNAGDTFYNESTLSTLYSTSISDHVVVLFGDTLFKYKNGVEKVIYCKGSNHKVMPSCHQSIFCRRELLKLFPFNLKYRIAADFAFFYQLKKQGYLYKYIDIIVAVYDASDGISSKNEEETKKEILEISNSLCLYHLKFFFFKVKQLSKRLLIRK